MSVDTSSFDDAFDASSYDGDDDDDAEAKPYAKMDDAKKVGENVSPASEGGSRVPIRNVLDVFQELKLAFGRI